MALSCINGHETFEMYMITAHLTSLPLFFLNKWTKLIYIQMYYIYIYVIFSDVFAAYSFIKYCSKLASYFGSCVTRRHLAR